MSDKGVGMLQKRSQAWATLRDREQDIERIVERGASSQDDVNLIRRCLCLVLGEITARRTGGVPL